MQYLYDYHTHSYNSMDGKNSIMEICQSAVEKDLKEIAITDHFEPTKEDEGYKYYNPIIYWSELLRARHKFRGRLTIKAGVELGQPHRFKETSELLLNAYPYDYVIGSAHKLSDGNDVGVLDYKNIDMDDLCSMYLEELKELAEWGKFDCIGHLDLIKRYGANHYADRITLMRNRELLEQVLKIIISKGKGIEINTSGLRQSPKEVMPGVDVLKYYKELGGEILTIGSDAHRCEDMGKGIVEAIELSREAGFDYLTVFNKRVPEWISIKTKKDSYTI